MKKILFAVALFAGMCFTSCGNKTAQGDVCDSVSNDTADTVQVDTTAVDSTVCPD